jgi:hypothetical protein
VKKDSIVLLQYHRAPSLVSHTRNFITSVPHFLTHAAGRVPIFDTAANEDEKCTAVIAWENAIRQNGHIDSPALCVFSHVLLLLASRHSVKKWDDKPCCVC